MFSAAGNRSQIDTLFPCHAPHRGAGGNRPGAVEHGLLFAAAVLPPVWRLRPALALASAGAAAQRCRCRRLGRFATGNREDGLAHLDRIAFFHQQFGHAAGMGARDLHDRLVGFQLDNAIVGRDCVALLDQHVHHVAAMDILAEFGKLEVDIHYALAI